MPNTVPMKRIDRALALAARVRPRPAKALGVLPPRARLITVGALAAAILVGGLYLFWFRDSSLVSVDKVEVVGASGGNAARIEQRLATAADGMTTLDVDTDALAQSVATFAEVRAVRAEPDFPHKLKIVVDERVAVAALHSGRSNLAVASDGTLLPQEGAGRLPSIPVSALPTGDRLSDPAALRAVAVLAAAKARLRNRVQTVEKGKGGLRATLRGGGTIVLGAPIMLRDKWIAAAKVLKDASAKGAKYIDVRIPGRPVAGGLPMPADAGQDGSGVPTIDTDGDGVPDTVADNGDGSDVTTDGTIDPSAAPN